MRAFIVTTFVGCFGVDEKNKIIIFIQFPKDAAKIAEKLKLSEIEIIEEEKTMQNQLWKKGYKKFVFGNRKSGVKNIEPNNQAEQFIKQNIRELAIDKKVVKDQVEFNQLLTKVNLELTKVKIKKAIGKDNLIIQANGALEELDKSINILVERLREWYTLHFPEMDRVISDHERFAEIVKEFGLREKITEENLTPFKGKSMGADLAETDIKAIQELASEIINLYQLRKSIENYIDKTLKEVAPNAREIAGVALTAKLIAKAGGLDKLSRMPSSTIQLLGAEKALFRHLHGHGRSPRFGLIFTHPLIQNAPEKLKGRVARVLASKLSIAVKMDFYSKKYKADELQKDLKERVKEILSSK